MERGKADLQQIVSVFEVFALVLSYVLSQFSDEFPPVFDFERS